MQRLSTLHLTLLKVFGKSTFGSLCHLTADYFKFVIVDIVHSVCKANDAYKFKSIYFYQVQQSPKIPPCQG